MIFCRESLSCLTVSLSLFLLCRGIDDLQDEIVYIFCGLLVPYEVIAEVSETADQKTLLKIVQRHDYLFIRCHQSVTSLSDFFLTGTGMCSSSGVFTEGPSDDFCLCSSRICLSSSFTEGREP